MMKLNRFKTILPAVVLALSVFGFCGCADDLHVSNENPQQDSKLKPDELLNKIYGNMAMTGQTGPVGSSDLDDLDEGFSSMVRQMWNANELTTDEAKCVWTDGGIPEYNENAYTDGHTMLTALYYRLYFGITLANFYLNEVHAASGETSAKRAEARFMRALYYYYLMDLYGNVPIYTKVTKNSVPQSTRAEVFAYIEKELKAVLGETADDNADVLNDKSTTYGRADKVAAEMLLSRLYLNAQVYTGTAQWEKAKEYAQKVIDSPYKLCTTPKNGYSAFQLLFMGDNDTNGAQSEIILPVLQDGDKTQTWGGSLFLVAAATDEDLAKSYPTGTSEKWGGNRATKQFAEKFGLTDAKVASAPTPKEVVKVAKDDRALFFTKGHTMSCDDKSSFNSGFAYVKFLNIHADGTAPHHTQFVDTDFPMFRVAEAYLTWAEADARLNGGRCSADGIAKINLLRKRANANTIVGSFNLNDLCDEWSREFAYEGMRRPTLVRFGKFGGQSDYTWQGMGGNYNNGTSFDAHFNIFAIPAKVINLGGMKQNDGYK